MDAAHPRARRTAEHLVVRLDTVADDPATAVLAMRRQRVDRALEAVEDMTATISRHFHDLVVLVLAHLTARHIVLPGGRRPAAPPAVEDARWLPVTGWWRACHPAIQRATGSRESSRGSRISCISAWVSSWPARRSSSWRSAPTTS